MRLRTVRLKIAPYSAAASSVACGVQAANHLGNIAARHRLYCPDLRARAKTPHKNLLPFGIASRAAFKPCLLPFSRMGTITSSVVPG